VYLFKMHKFTMCPKIIWFNSTNSLQFNFFIQLAFLLFTIPHATKWLIIFISWRRKSCCFPLLLNHYRRNICILHGEIWYTTHIIHKLNYTYFVLDHNYNESIIYNCIKSSNIALTNTGILNWSRDHSRSKQYWNKLK